MDTSKILALVSATDVRDGSTSRETRLVVMTSPSSPQSDWTYRFVGTFEGNWTPGGRPSVSMAVDLIPDLDGTTNQQLTHDFGEPDWAGQRDISWIIALGVACALTVLYGLRWFWRRRTHLL